MQVVIGPKQSLYPLGAVRVYEGLKMSIRTLRPREVRINPSCYADPEFDVRFEYPGLEATKARFERMLAQALKEFPDLIVEEEEEEEEEVE